MSNVEEVGLVIQLQNQGRNDTRQEHEQSSQEQQLKSPCAHPFKTSFFKQTPLWENTWMR